MRYPVLRLGGDRISRTVALLVILCLVPLPVGAASPDAQKALPAVADLKPSDLNVVVRDINTGRSLAETRIYLDGEYQGMTAGDRGSLALPAVAPGDHTLRAIRRGYLENITTIHVPDERTGVLLLHPAKIIPIGDHGPEEERIDIVFVPSSTQYDCTKQEKTVTDYYTGNEENFRNDADRLVRKFLALDRMTSASIDLPQDFATRFNFYYYSHPGDYADAFSECAGTLPEDFLDDAPYADVAIIVYPKYVGTYTGPPCEPTACTSSMGPGINSRMKIQAGAGLTFIHEAGHLVFGLIDTYCGETFYTQNDPYPNVWGNRSACTRDASGTGRDPASCRQIARAIGIGNTELCTKNYWRSDPDPDIMRTTTFGAKFGNASVLHMRYMLENINRWRL